MYLNDGSGFPHKDSVVVRVEFAFSLPCSQVAYFLKDNLMLIQKYIMSRPKNVLIRLFWQCYEPKFIKKAPQILSYV